MASGGDGKIFSNISATTASFPLFGGEYGITASCASWGGGTVQLEVLGPDQATWIAAATALSANGFQVIDLPPGSYQLALTNASAVYASVARINL
jgi:hypothetical protein